MTMCHITLWILFMTKYIISFACVHSFMLKLLHNYYKMNYKLLLLQFFLQSLLLTSNSIRVCYDYPDPPSPDSYTPPPRVRPPPRIRPPPRVRPPPPALYGSDDQSQEYAFTFNSTVVLVSMCGKVPTMFEGSVRTPAFLNQWYQSKTRLPTLSNRPTFAEYIDRAFRGLVGFNAVDNRVLEDPVVIECDLVPGGQYNDKCLDWATDVNRNSSQYSSILMVVFPDNAPCNAGGRANIWYSYTHTFNDETMMHEYGHNLRLPHSGSINTTGGVDEYGDFSCVMGNGKLFNVPQTTLLWRPLSAPIEYVNLITRNGEKGFTREVMLPNMFTTSQNHIKLELYDMGFMGEEAFSFFWVSYYPPNVPRSHKDAWYNIREEWDDNVYIHGTRGGQPVVLKRLGVGDQVLVRWRDISGGQTCCKKANGMVYKRKLTNPCGWFTESERSRGVRAYGTCPTDNNKWYDVFELSVLGRSEEGGMRVRFAAPKGGFMSLSANQQMSEYVI